MTTQEQRILLPIGSRVTHWDGGDSTHGKGTIIGYNGIEPMDYLRTNFKEAVEMAAGAGLIGGLVNAMYDKNRCPYIVQFDIRQGDDEKSVEMRTKYPRGYRDVYELDSVRSYPNPNYSFTIFPNDWVRVMGRQWNEERSDWGPWLIIPEDLYEQRKNEESVKKDWQFCIRPLPTPTRRNSPVNGDFVPLTLEPGGTKCDLKGFHPPHGIFVEFKIHGSDEVLLGMTSELIMLPPGGKWKVVFTTVEPGKERVYLVKEVSHWRELIERERFTPTLMEHVEHSFIVYNHETSTKAPQ
jgi:hypothetical protein